LMSASGVPGVTPSRANGSDGQSRGSSGNSWALIGSPSGCRDWQTTRRARGRHDVPRLALDDPVDVTLGRRPTLGLTGLPEAIVLPEPFALLGCEVHFDLVFR